MQDTIIVEHLNKTFPSTNHDGFAALRDVSLRVPSGAFYGILGESGSGKSTLAALIAGFATPDSGKIFLSDTCLIGLTPKQWRVIYRDLQLVFQNAFLSFNPRQTFARTILQAKRQQGKMPQAKLDAIYPLIDLFSLPRTLLDCYPHEVSGGECQRMAIVRALAAEPSVLVLDEATSALDARIGKQTLDVILNYQRNHDLTVLFISHNIAIAQTYCSHIAIMQKGHIVESGTTAGVLERPTDPYTKQLIKDAAAQLRDI